MVRSLIRHFGASMQAAMTHGQWRDISLDILCISVFWKERKEEKTCHPSPQGLRAQRKQLLVSFSTEALRHANPIRSQADQNKNQSEGPGNSNSGGEFS